MLSLQTGTHTHGDESHQGKDFKELMKSQLLSIDGVPEKNLPWTFQLGFERYQPEGGSVTPGVGWVPSKSNYVIQKAVTRVWYGYVEELKPLLGLHKGHLRHSCSW